MGSKEYHRQIVEYYNSTENSYKDSWDLENSHAIHYGYRDEKARTFPQSLLRMNEVMMEAAGVGPSDKVLDAGCGIGGSCFFLVEKSGCQAIGISLSEQQIQKAKSLALKKKLNDKTNFEVMDYCHTAFADASFDVVFACESVCYAVDKERFIREAYRLLKPGGRLVLADGFATEFDNNNNPVLKKWLEGWLVNYLESPARFEQFMQNSGFKNIFYRDISKHTLSSARRLYVIYFVASLYVFFKKLMGSDKSTPMQRANIRACKYQYLGLKKGLWQYGLFVGWK